jgi:three-Cys-motif partner protein
LHIKNKPYPIFGSAIIPLITPTIGEIKFRRKPKPFKYVILVEKARARRALLRKVVQEVEQKLKELRLPTPEINYYDDINAKRDAITRLLAEQCRYVLAVVDPTGAEIKWDTIKAILELRQQDVIVDVMFNFMCAALRRQKKKHAKKRPATPSTSSSAEITGDNVAKTRTSRSENASTIPTYKTSETPDMPYTRRISGKTNYGTTTST